MSGFAGIVCTGGTTPDPAFARTMAARLAFRGPDATQIGPRAGAGFCFTLLRTGLRPNLRSNLHAGWTACGCSVTCVSTGGRPAGRQLEQRDESITAEVTDEELILRACGGWGKMG